MPSTRVPTSSVVSVGGGPPPPSGYGGGISAAALTNHINDAVGAHAASAISYLGGNNWADGTTNPSGNVETQLDKVVDDLRGTSITTAGTYKVGADALVRTSFTVPASTLRAQLFALSLASNQQYLNAATNWFNGDSLADQSVQDALKAIVIQLAASAATSGSSRIGCGARTTWAGDSTTNPADSVFFAIDKIITDLGSQTASTSGARKVRVEALGNWLDGLTNPATTVYGALNKIITDLNDNVGNDGAGRIGAQTYGFLSAGSVSSQLKLLHDQWAKIDQDITWTGGTHIFNGKVEIDNSFTFKANTQAATWLARVDQTTITDTANQTITVIAEEYLIPGMTSNSTLNLNAPVEQGQRVRFRKMANSPTGTVDISVPVNGVLVRIDTSSRAVIELVAVKTAGNDHWVLADAKALSGSISNLNFATT